MSVKMFQLFEIYVFNMSAAILHLFITFKPYINTYLGNYNELMLFYNLLH